MHKQGTPFAVQHLKMEDFIDSFDRIHPVEQDGDATEANVNPRSEHIKFEHFLEYAKTNQEQLDAALEELKQQKLKMDPVRLRTYIDTEKIGLEQNGIEGFPTCIDESVKTPCYLWELWDRYIDEYQVQEIDFPSVVVCGDIDSIYTFNQSLSQIVDSCGSESLWSMASILRAESADTGSRFCVNSDLCESKPFLRNGIAKTVPLNWFPNVKIATVYIGAPFCREMHIQMYFLGVEGFSSNSYFTKLQLGVINAMFNLAILFLTNEENTDRSVQRQLGRFYNLETLTGSRSWTGSRKASINSLTSEAMKALAKKAVEALDLIANNDEKIKKFEDPFVNGVQPEDKREETLDRQQMAAFAQRLSKAMCFTASLAGCKGSFTKNRYERVVELNPLNYRYINHDESGSDDLSAEDQSQQQDIDWFEYCTELNRGITQAMNELNEELFLSLRKALNANSDPSGEAHLHRKSNWYVDKAFEVSLDHPDLCLLSMIQPSKGILKGKIGER